MGNPINYVDPTGLYLLQIGGAIIGGTVNAVINYNDFRSGNISSGDYAKLIGVGAVTGTISTLGGGIVSGALLGGIGSATNSFATQKIKSDNVNFGKVGESFGVGLGVGALGGIGAAIGSNIIKYPKELFIGGSPVINYGGAGGLIGTTVGTILTQEPKKEKRK